MPLPSSLIEYGSKIKTQAATAGNSLSTAASSVKDTFSLNNIKSKLFGKTPNTADATGTDTTSRSSSGSAADRPIGKDLRIRISLPPQSPKFFYKDPTNGIMSPLQKTNGFIFPIQPQVALGYEAAYQETALTHSNFPYYNYQNSKLSPIQITGDFPIRTTFDANYVMAGIHFLRTCTRMFNGQDGQYAGAPPMVLRLTGMGFSGYDNLPVVITSFTATYTESVDHITFKPFVNYGSTTDIPKEIDVAELAKLPVVVQISLQMNPVFSRDFITNHYSTLKYSTGQVRLVGDKFWSMDPEPVSVAGIPTTPIGTPTFTSGAFPGPPDTTNNGPGVVNG